MMSEETDITKQRDTLLETMKTLHGSNEALHELNHTLIQQRDDLLAALEEEITPALKLLAGDLLPKNMVWTSEEAKDARHREEIIKWLNEREPEHGPRTIGGDYYVLACVMAEMLMDVAKVAIAAAQPSSTSAQPIKSGTSK